MGVRSDAGTQFAERGLFIWPGLDLLAMPVKAALWDPTNADDILAMNAALEAQADSAAVRKLVPDEQTSEIPDPCPVRSKGSVLILEGRSRTYPRLRKIKEIELVLEKK
jgi:hypothetical protein